MLTPEEDEEEEELVPPPLEELDELELLKLLPDRLEPEPEADAVPPPDPTPALARTDTELPFGPLVLWTVLDAEPEPVAEVEA